MRLRGWRFPSGIVVQSCRDVRDPVGLLKQVLSSFDVKREQPDTSDPKQLADIAQKLLRGRKTLVVLDNVEPDDPDPAGNWKLERVVTPLRQAGAALLLTARQVLPTSAVPLGASHELPLLSFEEALALLFQARGQSAQEASTLPAADHAAAQRIVRALERHTLAVKLAGAYAGSVRRDLTVLARGVGGSYPSD